MLKATFEWIKKNLRVGESDYDALCQFPPRFIILQYKLKIGKVYKNYIATCFS